MPIPGFTIDGVIPPFVGPDGPGGSAEDMTPYQVSACELAQGFGATARRRDILLGWLQFRTALRSAGIVQGFQWIDGSFVEDKEPNDADVMTFFYRPAVLNDPFQRPVWLGRFGYLFNRTIVKWMFKVDSFNLDLSGNAETLVDLTRYYGSLFSHRRGDNLWKGMLSVRLEDPSDDQAAVAVIGHPPEALAPGAMP